MLLRGNKHEVIRGCFVIGGRFEAYRQRTTNNNWGAALAKYVRESFGHGGAKPLTSMGSKGRLEDVVLRIG